MSRAWQVFEAAFIVVIYFGSAVFLCWLAVVAASAWRFARDKQSRRIRYRELNKHRITPRFTVGGDAK
jgi:hypothetical protein